MRAPRALAAALPALLLLLGGCVHTPAPTYAPGNDNLMALRAQPGGKLAVDAFQAAPKVANTSLGLRGNSMSGGSDGTYTTYLQQALEAELRNAGRFDAASGTRISGVLLANQLDASGTRTGKASIRARFVVTRDGVVAYDKPLQADHEWESSFMGMVAVPAAMENYVATLQKLIGMLLVDPEFIEASR